MKTRGYIRHQIDKALAANLSMQQITAARDALALICWSPASLEALRVQLDVLAIKHLPSKLDKPKRKTKWNNRGI